MLSIPNGKAYQTGREREGKGKILTRLDLCPDFLPDLLQNARGWKLRFHRPVEGTGVIKIVDVRFGIEFGIDHAHKPSPIQETADLARGIIEIPEYPGFSGADHYTGRFQAPLQTAVAKIAFVGDPLCGMKKARAVRAS